MVVLEGVWLTRDGRPILEGIDWVVREGERWIVLGPNGAGKTTLLEVASLYLFPSAGRVTVLGATHGRTDVRPLRSRIGYASAALARLLHPDLTVLQAVATGRSGVLDPYWAEPAPEDVSLAVALLARLGCSTLALHALGTLSEGERQRVQVARALMASPDLLLLDEPSAGLDLEARELLVRSLAGLAADRRMRSIVFVTQHVEEIPAGFTHALLLRRGRVLAAGPLESTLTAKSLTACFGLPLEVEARNGRWSARAADLPGTTKGRPPAGRPARSGDRARAGETREPRGPRESATGRGPAGTATHAEGPGPGGTAASVEGPGPGGTAASVDGATASADGAAPGGAPAPGDGSGHEDADDPADGEGIGERRTLVRDPDGRLKAFRPLPPEERLGALDRSLAAYAAGDFFAAHEILEPGWMGSDDQSERALHQALIKLAAAGVHAVRGNPEGVRRNLQGSARRLALVPDESTGTLGDAIRRVDLPATRAWIAAALAAFDHAPDAATLGSLAGLIAAGPAPVSRAAPVTRAAPAAHGAQDSGTAPESEPSGGQAGA